MPLKVEATRFRRLLGLKYIEVKHFLFRLRLQKVLQNFSRIHELNLVKRKIENIRVEIFLFRKNCDFQLYHMES